MKRGVFGVILLVLIFFLGLTQMRDSRKELRPIAADMELASQAVLQGDLKKAAALTDGARAAWEDIRLKFSCLSQQQAVRSIDSLYDEVRVFLIAGEAVHCGAACEALKNQLRALQDDQQLDLLNLL